MCGEASADDVVQETFTALLRTHRFDPARGTLPAYLFGIARHHILKRLAIGQSELPLDDSQSGDVVSTNGPTVFDESAVPKQSRRFASPFDRCRSSRELFAPPADYRYGVSGGLSAALRTVENAVAVGVT